MRVGEVIDMLDRVKPDTRQLRVAVIAGWPDNPATADYRVEQTSLGLAVGAVCNPATGPATPALRLKGFVDRLGSDRGLLQGICDGSWHDKMTAVAHFLSR